MSEYDTLFPAVHRFGEEQLGLRDIDGRTHFKVIPIKEANDDMKDYFAHETVRFFGDDEDRTPPASEEASRAAAERLTRRQNAEEYLKAYSNADNMDGEDMPKGALDVTDEYGVIEVTCEDGLDLELLEHLSIERPEIAECVKHGAPVQAHYLKALGTIDSENADIVEAFEDLRSSGSLRDVQSSLVRLMKMLPPRHARRLRTAVTQTLNDCVTVRMGTNFRVDDFIEDIGDLVEVVEDKFGATYTQILSDKVPGIIGETCAILIDVSNEDDSEPSQYQHCTIGLYTSIPIESTRLNWAIGSSRSFGFVSKSRFPELYNALEGMLNTKTQLDKKALFHDIRIETLDGYVVRVHRSLLGDKLLLSKA